MMEKQDYFQYYMAGNVCFGCGWKNPEGLQIESYWEGELGVCIWQPQEKYHGKAQVLNGGILATLVDCHCMGTAMADAYRREGRPLGSAPHYRYLTGSLNVRYRLPTPTTGPITLRARVTEASGRKTRLFCEVFAGGQMTAESEVLAIQTTEIHPDPDAAG